VTQEDAVPRTSLTVRAVELREVALPLRAPFRTSFGEETDKRAILVRVDCGDVTGWGECVAAETPRYSEEWLDGAWAIMAGHLLPAILGMVIGGPDDVARRLGWVRGHRMSKAVLETAALDAWLRLQSVSLASFLGAVRDRIPCGVSVGIAPSAEAMLEEVRGHLGHGYQRIKLKIEPGRDVEVVRTIREALPDVPLSVDANAAYSLADLPVFEALDELGLVMIEQPLGHEDLLEHARLQARIETPVCLDESIRSAADAAAAIEMGACRVINIKPGRVGGPMESRRIHDIARERGIPVWIGGMLETGVGRALNVALAAMPGVTMPGDTSGSDRYFREDLTPPFEVAPDGTMAVPSWPGLGVEPLEGRLAAVTVRTARFAADR
jgi:O-succinylbenzoate synthase